MGLMKAVGVVKTEEFMIEKETEEENVRDRLSNLHQQQPAPSWSNVVL